MADVMLHIQQVAKRYGGVHAVVDVTIELRSGSIVGVIGPNGAGKSTLVNIASGQVVPNSGRVLLDGHDVTKLPSCRRFEMGLARTFQGLRLYQNLTCYENLLAGNLTREGRLRARRARAAALMDELDLWEYATSLPDNVPFGKQKLVAIGRALLGHPSILLLDEPFAGLTDQETEDIGQLLKRLTAETRAAVMVVEHNLDALSRLVSRMAVLDQGRLLAEGPPLEVLEMESVKHAYFGAHRKKDVEEAMRSVLPVGHAGEAVSTWRN